MRPTCCRFPCLCRTTAGAAVIALGILATAAAPARAACVEWSAGPGPTPWNFDLRPDGINDVKVVGTTAWVARTFYGALVSVDVTDPAAPLVMGEEPVFVMDETYRVEVNGDLAFLTYIQWGGPAGVRVFDISDAANPTDIGDLHAPSGNWAFDLAARDDLLYVSFPGSGVGVIDVSDPTAPTLIGQVAVGTAHEITLAGNLLYVATDDQPRIVDVTDPTAPIVLGILPTAVRGTEVAVSGNLAFVATMTGVSIFDVSEPALPILLGSLATPNTATSIGLSGDVAYVSVRNSGVHAIDVRDTANPRLIGVMPTPDVQWGNVGVFDDRMYLAYDVDLYITPQQCALAPAAVGLPPAGAAPRLWAAPNPFNPQTAISFALPAAGMVTLEIFDPAGRRVRTLARSEALDAGPHSRTWNGRDDAGRELPSGTYVCRVQAGGAAASSRLTLLR